MANCVDNIVTGIEKKFGVQAVESEGAGLFYLQDDEREMMGILSVIDGKPTCAILKKKQIKFLIKELKDIYDMLFN